MIHVIATIQVNPGCREEFLREFRRVIEPTRAEAGCIEYQPVIETESGIPMQAEPRPNIVIILEKWADVAALESHLASPHMAEYRERVDDLVSWVDLRILEPA